MSTKRHHETVARLENAILAGCEELNRVRVFAELRIQWNHPTIEPHLPDIAVFESMEREFNIDDGTLNVLDLNAKIAAVIEVTSESTRHIDLGSKFDEYEELGIPYFLIVDLAAPNGIPRMLGFRHSRGAYREMQSVNGHGLMIPTLKLWFRWENDRIVIADEDGKEIPDNQALKKSLEAEKQRAEAEKQRADTLAAELAALKARLDGTNTKD